MIDPAASATSVGELEAQHARHLDGTAGSTKVMREQVVGDPDPRRTLRCRKVDGHVVVNVQCRKGAPPDEVVAVRLAFGEERTRSNGGRRLSMAGSGSGKIPSILAPHDAAMPHIRWSGQRAAGGVQQSYRGAMTHEHSSGCPAMPEAEASPA